MESWSDAQLSNTFRGAQSREVRMQLAQELGRRRALREQQELQAELKVLRMEAERRIKYIAGTKCSDMMQACLYGYYVQNQKQVVVARSLGLPNENRVSMYVRDGCKQLARIWSSFM